MKKLMPWWWLINWWWSLSVLGLLFIHSKGMWSGISMLVMPQQCLHQGLGCLNYIANGNARAKVVTLRQWCCCPYEMAAWSESGSRGKKSTSPWPPLKLMWATSAERPVTEQVDYTITLHWRSFLEVEVRAKWLATLKDANLATNHAASIYRHLSLTQKQSEWRGGGNEVFLWQRKPLIYYFETHTKVFPHTQQNKKKRSKEFHKGCKAHLMEQGMHKITHVTIRTATNSPPFPIDCHCNLWHVFI